MGRIRLLYCIDSVEHDAGPDKQLAEMIRRIDPDGFEVHLCCVRDCARMHDLREHCIPLLLPMRSIYSLNGLRRIRQLRRYINTQKIDIVHTFMVKANLLGILAAKRSRCGVVLSSRRNTNYWLTPLYRRLYRYLNRHTTRLVANSEGVKRAIVETERVSPDRVDVMYNGVDMAAYARDRGDLAVCRRLGVPESARVVGIVANLRPVKDHDLFLRAAKLVGQRVPNAAFLLVGTGPLRRELARRAAELGLSERTFFTDGRGTVPDSLRRMDVGCLTSRTEGFSNAILEYLAAGLPVVATDVGGNAEAVEQGVTGYVVETRNPEDIAARIVELLQDEDRRSQMGRRALDRCREIFDIRQTIRRYEEYYKSLVTEARR